MHTQEQAEKTRCCGPSENCGRFVSAHDAAMDPDQFPHGSGFYCIGAGCMGWEWVEPRISKEWTDAVRKVAAETNDREATRRKSRALVDADPAAYGLPDKPTEGYCRAVGQIQRPYLGGKS